jgi:hypothetical protein
LGTVVSSARGKDKPVERYFLMSQAYRRKEALPLIRQRFWLNSGLPMVL